MEGGLLEISESEPPSVSGEVDFARAPELFMAGALAVPSDEGGRGGSGPWVCAEVVNEKVANKIGIGSVRLKASELVMACDSCEKCELRIKTCKDSAGLHSAREPARMHQSCDKLRASG